MLNKFFKQFDGLTLAVAASLLSITVMAILAINHMFVDRMLLNDAQNLTSNAAHQIRREFFSDVNNDSVINLADALSSTDNVPSHMKQSFSPRSMVSRGVSDFMKLPKFKAQPLIGAPKLKEFIDNNINANAYLNELNSYAIYLPTGSVFLPAKLFDDPKARQKYSSAYSNISSVQSVFINGKSLYAIREGVNGTYTQHYVPLTKNNVVVGVVMLEALQTGAGIKMASAVSSAVTMTTIAGFPVVLLVIYLAWSRVQDSARARQEITFLEFNDPLTELPNRIGFTKVLEDTINEANKNKSQFAILSLDLDGFHKVNDIVGQQTGDAMLIEVVRRILSYKPASATMSRLSGDEFAIIVPGVGSAEEASQLAKVFLEEIAQPYPCAGENITCSASIGIVFGPEHGIENDALVKNAKLALYRAKKEGGNTFRFFEPDMDEALQKRRLLEKHLSQAIERNEFELYYQPQVELSGRSIMGYEALLRWHHPDLGMVSPVEFIPVLEETRLIIEVGEYVLMRACHEAMTWHNDEKVAVNLSPVQFESNDVPAMVARALESSGLPAERLEIEITESVLMSDKNIAVTMLSALKDLGVNIAMDDFGTGYSSLSYIADFDFDKIKIDRSFVSSIQTDERARAIITTVIGLGRALDIMITAEGIETNEQLLLIQAAGCHFGQGYLFGRPVPLKELHLDEDVAPLSSQVA